MGFNVLANSIYTLLNGDVLLRNKLTMQLVMQHLNPCK